MAATPVRSARCQIDSHLRKVEPGVSDGHGDIASGQHPDSETRCIALNFGDGNERTLLECLVQADQRARLRDEIARICSGSFSATTEHLSVRTEP